MTDVRALRQEVTKRRASVVESDFGEIPSSIPYLEGLLQKASSLDDSHLLFALILGECTRADNRPAEVHYLRRQLAALPLQPIFLASLASALASVPGAGSEALTRCLEAVNLAQKEDRQVRYCLTVQARVALALHDHETLAASLKGLIADAKFERAEDSGYEFDFVDQIDAQRIDPTLLAEYKALALSRGLRLQASASTLLRHWRKDGIGGTLTFER